MLGAISGDVLGSTYESYPTKIRAFNLMPDHSCITDDTVCTVAIASALLRDRPFDQELRAWASTSSFDNFGSQFQKWVTDGKGRGNSAGNGSAMRVSSIAWLSPTLAGALDLAARSARTSHDHPESVTAAMATVAAARLGIEGWGRADMGAAIQLSFGYDLATPLATYRPDYEFDVLAAATVRPSLRAVIEANSFEDAIRNAISMGGDADTMAAIAGGVAEAWDPVPPDIRAFVTARLPRPVSQVLAAFEERSRKVRRVVTPPDEVRGVLDAAVAKWVVPVKAPGKWGMARVARLLGRSGPPPG